MKSRSGHSMIMAAAVTALIAPLALAQNGRPAPTQPQTSGSDLARADIRPDRPSPDDSRQLSPQRPSGPLRDREIPEEQVILAFDDVSVTDTIQFIVETTGKVVMPLQPGALKGRKISLINDKPVSRAEALDLLFTAFRLNGIGIIERDDIIIIDTLDNIARTNLPPVIDSSLDVMNRTDIGVVVLKLFKLDEAPVEDIAEQLESLFQLGDKLAVDPNSNQIMVLGDIGLQQQIQRIVNELDETWINAETRTFRLQYADAGEVTDNIYDLFESDGASGAASRRTSRRTRNPRQAAQQQVPGVGPGPTVELRVTVAVPQNSLTVQAAPSIVSEIEHLINSEWDLPRAPETSKIYALKYTDPIKVRDLLRELLGAGSSGARRAGQSRGTPGGQGRSDVAEQLGGVYQIEAYPDANSLVVLCKTTESLDFLDHLVNELDQPSEVGLPQVVPLKHANAVEVAQEINALLSTGGNITLEAPETGLTGEGIEGQDSQSGGTTAGGAGGQTAGQIQLPWQRGQQPEDQSPESALIGKTRVVPIVRQNALAVLAPPAMREHIKDAINQFDKPGRQVMISAIIAEVELTDDFALGLRVSNSGDVLGGGNPDNRIGGTFNTSASEDPFLDGLFDTSVLDVSVNINAVIQALNEITNVRVLQQPRVFTADNQEAQFFDGQDFPFLTNVQTTDQGTVNESIERRPVGIFLNVRPRITAQKDIDLDINLELSSIVPGQTQFGSAIVDRRTTTTNVILQDRQTIVLSGILTDRESQITRKVPLLGDIPIIGELFTSRENSKTTTELIAFITPHVVDSPSELKDFNEKDSQRLDDMSMPLKEQDPQSNTPKAIRERLLPPDVKGLRGRRGGVIEGEEYVDDDEDDENEPGEQN